MHASILKIVAAFRISGAYENSFIKKNPLGFGILNPIKIKHLGRHKSVVSCYDFKSNLFFRRVVVIYLFVSAASPQPR